jgi:hypothetical protein
MAEVTEGSDQGTTYLRVVLHQEEFRHGDTLYQAAGGSDRRWGVVSPPLRSP